MQSRVKSAQKWQKSRPLFKCTVSWKTAQKVMIKKAGRWSQAYLNERKVILSGQQSTFNLYQRIGVPTEPLIVVEIAPDCVITAAHSLSASFSLGHGYPGKTILIRNRGVIRGCGGQGGQGGSGLNGTHGGHGEQGGTALKVSEAQCRVIIENFGRIGGGGGGGGGGSALYGGSNLIRTQSLGTAGTHGSHGFGGAAPAPSRAQYRHWGNASGWSRWFTVGSIPSFLKAHYFKGGRGGAGASAGANGLRNEVVPTSGYPGSFFHIYQPGRGGRAGYAIDGISKAQLTHTGTVSGAQVN